MSPNKKHTNPFYVLLVITGVVFTITACAYGVMTVRQIRPTMEQTASTSGTSMLAFLDENGLELLIGELVVLAIATVAAIGTDQYWITRREKSLKSNKRESAPHDQEANTHESESLRRGGAAGR